jgi:hypothetical protein
LREVRIPKSIETFEHHCFAFCETIRTVVFEFGCKLSCIEGCAFCGCSSLSSICIPSSVTKLGERCFMECLSLSTVTFESGSKLSSLERAAFWACPRLSLCIPPSLRTIFRGYGRMVKVIADEPSALA